MANEKESIGETSRRAQTRVKLMVDAVERHYTGDNGAASLESALFHLENAQAVLRRLKRDIVKHIPAVKIHEEVKARLDLSL